MSFSKEKAKYSRPRVKISFLKENVQTQKEAQVKTFLLLLILHAVNPVVLGAVQESKQ